MAPSGRCTAVNIEPRKSACDTGVPTIHAMTS